jgi:hypothetical protein
MLAEGATIVTPGHSWLGNGSSSAKDHEIVRVYLHDSGAPVGLQIAMHAPELVSGLIIQNANAHRTGFGPYGTPH